MVSEAREYRKGGEPRIKNSLEWGKANIGLSDEEAKLMERFATHAMSVGLQGVKGKPRKSSPSHAANAVSILIAFRRYVKKPFHMMGRDDIIEAIRSFETSDVSYYRGKVVKKKKSVNTRWQYILNLKLYLLWLSDEKKIKLKHDEVGKLIALPTRNKNTFQDTDILKPEEITAVIMACETARDRCYFSMLYDGMFRSKELAEMRWKDLIPVTFGEDDRLFYRATTSGKTGEIRKPLLTRSTVYINEWKNQYPGKPEGDALVFLARGNKQFTYVTARHMIEHIKIKLLREGHEWAEKLALHQFRRASITHASDEKRPVSHICRDAWGRSYSAQFERYNKPGQADLDQSKLEAAGVTPKRKYIKREKALEPNLCVCGTLCPPHMKFCPKCGKTLTAEAAKEKADVSEKLLTILNELTPEQKARVAESLLK